MAPIKHQGLDQSPVPGWVGQTIRRGHRQTATQSIGLGMRLEKLEESLDDGFWSLIIQGDEGTL